MPKAAVSQSIGPYGPFRVSLEFTFSDFESWGGAHNRGFVSCVEACRGKRCILDVGAHIGLVTMPVASVLAPGGKVYSFEPAVANAAALRLHVELNKLDNVEVVETLVGDTSKGDVSFFESVGPHGQNSLVLKSETTLVSEHGGYSETLKRQITIDDFCGERDIRPEVIKIDVEGAEIAVLRGAKRVLESLRPIVYLSVHPREIALIGESVDQLRATIDELGYDIEDVYGQRISEFALDEYVMVPRARQAPE